MTELSTMRNCCKIQRRPVCVSDRCISCVLRYTEHLRSHFFCDFLGRGIPRVNILSSTCSKLPIQMEQRSSYFGTKVQSPSKSFDIIPATQLFHCLKRLDRIDGILFHLNLFPTKSYMSFTILLFPDNIK